MVRTEKDYYHSLHRVAATINSTNSAEAVLNFIVENIARTLEVKGCSLMMLTPDKTLLLHSATYGLSKQYVRKGPVSADRSISEALMGKPVAVLDATQDERIQYREQARKEGIASLLSVPMSLRDEIIGVIRAYTSEPMEFTAEDTFFIAAVANLGAIALENLRLYNAVQKDYETFRNEMLEWRAALGYEWMIGESAGLPEETGPTIEPG